MDKRITKTTIISLIITLVIIIPVMGGLINDWFGIDLGIFKWIIFAVVLTINNCIAVSQANKVMKKDETYRK